MPNEESEIHIFHIPLGFLPGSALGFSDRAYKNVKFSYFPQYGYKKDVIFCYFKFLFVHTLFLETENPK